MNDIENKIREWIDGDGWQSEAGEYMYKYSTIIHDDNGSPIVKRISFISGLEGEYPSHITFSYSDLIARDGRSYDVSDDDFEYYLNLATDLMMGDEA